jgi:hypothetical protein
MFYIHTKQNRINNFYKLYSGLCNTRYEIPGQKRISSSQEMFLSISSLNACFQPPSRRITLSRLRRCICSTSLKTPPSCVAWAIFLQALKPFKVIAYTYTMYNYILVYKLVVVDSPLFCVETWLRALGLQDQASFLIASHTLTERHAVEAY